ncbi:MAG: response regulator [Solirubrobacteraceae bacterium]|nr:response regulator [Solirubrobacteraceae bacterium]
MIRVLIVEDDALVAEVHASYVERVPGFAVAGVAHRATEALEMLGERTIDLVLLDFHLPDARGLDLLRAVRARSASPVDVIAVTAARDQESIRSAIATGVSQYLVKPFAFATFADKLERYARYREQVAGTPEADQAGVDALLGTLRGPSPGRTLPKGLNATTLEGVRGAIAAADGPLTAAEVAGHAGLSRVTARRYLEHLVVENDVILTMRYGRTGRPEHLYAAPGSAPPGAA